MTANETDRTARRGRVAQQPAIRLQGKSMKRTDNVNRQDEEDCEACGELENQCLYHEGFDAGFRAAREFIIAAFDDPEQVAMPRPVSTGRSA